MKHHIRILDRRELVSVNTPPADMFTPEYAAHVFSQINRFGGHTPSPYSVAQHCVLVSYLTPRRFSYEGLWHETDELVTSDVINPIKTDDNRALGRSIRAVAAIPLGLAFEEPAEVKDADNRALAFEQSLLQGDPFAEIADLWRGQLTHLRDVMDLVRPMHHKRAAEAFLERHYELVRVAV